MSWDCPNCGASHGNCSCTQEQINNVELPGNISDLKEEMVELRKSINVLIKKIGETK